MWKFYSNGRALGLVATLAGGALTAPSTANAAAVVTTGTPTLYAGSPSQSFSVLVSGTDQIAGSDLWIQIGDGGPDNGGTTVAPKIVSINMLGGTIFSSNNNTGNVDNFSPSVDLAPDGLIATDFANTTTGTTVLDTGILATVTLNTTGFAPGTVLKVSYGNVGTVLTGAPENTDFFDSGGTLFPATLPGVGGVPASTITLVASPIPEPASIALVTVAATGLLARRRRV